MADDLLAPPAFEPAAALLQLTRTLRDLRPLAERGNGFDLKGQTVIQLAVDASAVSARLARRPTRSPEWDRFTLTSSPDLRRFADEVKKRLTRWAHED